MARLDDALLLQGDKERAVKQAMVSANATKGNPSKAAEREAVLAAADAARAEWTVLQNEIVQIRHAARLKLQHGKRHLIGGASRQWLVVVPTIPDPRMPPPALRANIHDNQVWDFIAGDATNSLIEVYHDPADMQGLDGNPLQVLASVEVVNGADLSPLSVVKAAGASAAIAQAVATFRARMAAIAASSTPVPRPAPKPLPRDVIFSG